MKKILPAPSINNFIILYGGKISVIIIVFCTLFLFVKKGFFTAVQEVGFVIFFASLLFTIICVKLNIAAHQQEHARNNFLQRKQKRAVLLIVLVCILEAIAVSILYNYPYAFFSF
jgi:hypothetical protein